VTTKIGYGFYIGHGVGVVINGGTTIGNNVFSDCIKLTSVDLPNVTSIGGGTFMRCSSLTSITLPKVKTLNGNMFVDCSSLTSLDLASATSIGFSAFLRCSKLATIILRSPTVCELSNTNAFTSTPFNADGSGGTVYVPKTLIESYQTAAKWSTLYAAGTCNFVAIEGSAYE
jgi:hypothetical protein